MNWFSFIFHLVRKPFSFIISIIITNVIMTQWGMWWISIHCNYYFTEAQIIPFSPAGDSSSWFLRPSDKALIGPSLSGT